MSWRIYNVDGCPVSQPCASEDEAWAVYARSVGMRLKSAESFRRQQELRGWRALERDAIEKQGSKQESERFIELRDIILKRCGLCECSRKLLLELAGFLDKE